MIKQIAYSLFALAGLLEAVEERDWVNDWLIQELPGTENLRSIEVDEIDRYNISVTYALDGGRFGDQMTNYLKALWISWKYDFPLIFRPFEYSDEFVFSEIHTTLLNDEVIQSFSAKLEYVLFHELEKSEVVFRHLNSKKSKEPKEKKLLWNIGLLTPFIEEHFCEKMDDEAFRDLMDQWVRPKKELALIPVPEGKKTIAIHVRTGVGYDWESNIENMPTKFPPDTFYLAGLRAAASIYKEEPLYVFIFTDHPEPAQIEEMFLRELKSLNIENQITFDCRRVGNSYTENVLEDLYSMMQFDCLIHPDSSLSRLAGILAAPSMEIRPSHWAEVRRDQDGIAIRDKNGKVIVDPLIIVREARGKPIASMHVEPVEPQLLF